MRSGGVWTGKDANPLWFDHRRGTEVHIDFAGRDQQINVVTLRNIFGPLQEIAQKDSRVRQHCGFDGLVDESVHARVIESEIVLQELQVSLEDPVDLLGASHSIIQPGRQCVCPTGRATPLAFAIPAVAVWALDGQLFEIL